jgi:hypothetical protein
MDNRIPKPEAAIAKRLRVQVHGNWVPSKELR